MTNLNAGTQRAQGFISAYKFVLLNHGKRTITEAYGRPSQAKKDAWDYCVGLCKEHNGKNLTVVGKTCDIFTAGFTFEEDGKRFLCYITPSNNYKIAL